MKNLSVKVKMTIIGLLVVVFMGVSVYYSVSSMRAIDKRILQEQEINIRKDYDDSIKQQVEQVITLLDSFKADIDAGIYTQEEGMKLAADKVRGLRYGEEGYFWIDQSDGINVVLLGNDIEGTNRLGTQDVTGFEMVRDFIQVLWHKEAITVITNIRKRGKPIQSRSVHIRNIINRLTG